MIRGLNSAVSALFAQQRRIETIAHNIANADTEGYARQEVRLASSTVTAPGGPYSTTAATGTGVRVDGVHRTVNELSQARALAAGADLAHSTAAADILGRIEDIFPEPSDFGLAERLGQFWSSWGDLALNPRAPEARAALMADTSDLLASFATAARGLGTISDGVRNQLASAVVEINDLTTRIADLNRHLGGLDAGFAENHLADERDLLMSRLAELTGAVSFRTETGALEVSAGGRVLVSGASRFGVELVGSDIVWGGDSQPIPGLGGKTGALLEALNTTVGRFGTMLDGVAADLVNQVNALHAAGFDLSGTSGRLFFDPAGTTAASIAVSGDPVNGVAGNLDRIAASATAAGSDGSQAQRLADLVASAAGPDSTYRSMIGVLGIESRGAQRRVGTAEVLRLGANEAVARESGVNIDEELTRMVEAQRSYAAAARVLTAVDEMLQTLVERTGLVGR